MTLGVTPKHDDMFGSSRAFCEEHLAEGSIFRLLADEGHGLFPDEAFADLFKSIGRRSVAPRIVATVMVLQRLEGLSDREATERFIFDVRWKYAAGVPSEFRGFVHTVLVDMRERLRSSKRPNRIFETVLDVVKQWGLVGRKRVLDSTALYDAVATQDTVTLIRSAIRGVLRAASDDMVLVAELRRVLRRDDDYASAGKPVCDWDDRDAREAVVDALARDGYALLAALDGRVLEPALRQAAELLLTVTGQDLEESEDGTFRIARRVAPTVCRSRRLVSNAPLARLRGLRSALRAIRGGRWGRGVRPAPPAGARKTEVGMAAAGERAAPMVTSGPPLRLAPSGGRRGCV